MIARVRKQRHEMTIFESKYNAQGVSYTPSNDMVLFCSVSGYGKTLAVERTAYEYWRNGFTVINLTDVKLNFETCFPMMPNVIIPEFHKYKLERQGEEAIQIPMKIYHPFSFNIPNRKHLPKINFFTMPLTKLKREHFSFLSETHTSSESVKLMLNATSKLKTDEGIYAFVHLINSLIEDKSSIYHGKKVKKINKEFFTTATTSGTLKDIQNIQSLFIPFKQDYFLSNDTCKLNIDFRKLINEQNNYHCLTYKWLKDEKMQYFTILCFLIGIDSALEYAKHPVVIVIDEIRKLVPDKATGYKDFLAEIIKNLLSTVRNKGKGVSVICGSQVFFDIEEDVRNSFTEPFFGRLPPQDIERLSKIHSWNQQDRRMMTTMKKNHFHRLGDADIKEYTLLFPPHAHKEPKFNFFEMYHKYYPYLERSYGVLVSDMKKSLEKETKEARKLAEQKDKRQKEEIKKAQEEKIGKSLVAKELEELKQQKKNETKSSKDDLMQKCYEIYTDPVQPKPPSFREIGRQLGLSFPTVKKYIEEYESKKNEQDSRPKI